MTAHPAKRWLQATGIRLAATAPVAAVLRALGKYPPAPRLAAGTTRVVESYGLDRLQSGEWWLPPGAGETAAAPPTVPPVLLPTVLLVHGGYWRGGYDRSLEDAVAADLAGRGYLCWVPDYRPSSSPWPATLADIAAAADQLVRGMFADRVDPARLSFVGHSAGGHLALWLASRNGQPSGAALAAAEGDGLAAGPESLRPTLVVSQAGVAALTIAATEHLGDDASVELVDGPPSEVDPRYAVADPLRLLPTGVRSVLIHGTADETVPLVQSTTYRDAAVAAGDDCALVEVPGAGHLDHLDPASACCEALRAALPAPVC